MPQRPQGQQIAEHYDVSSPKPVGRSDALPNQGGTPYRAPSGRDDTDKPEGRPALFSTKSLIGIGDMECEDPSPRGKTLTSYFTNLINSNGKS